MRFLLVLLLVGCGVQERVEFSSETVSRQTTAEALERYMSAPIPRWFVMSRDGLHYASAVCYGACTYIDREYVMDACRRRSQRCAVYAEGRKVVWHGPSPL